MANVVSLTEKGEQIYVKGIRSIVN